MSGVEYNPDEFEVVEPAQNTQPGVQYDPTEYEPVDETVKPIEPVETPEDSLGQSMYVASQKNPETTAKAIKLANKYNISTQLAEDSLDTLSKEDEAKSINASKIFSATPALGRFLTNPDNASVAKDDMEALGKVESAAKNQGFGSNLVNAVKSGFFKTLSGLAKAPALSYSEAPGPDWLYEGSYGAVARAEAQKEAGPVPESLYKNSVTKYLDEKASQYAPEQMSLGIIESARGGNYADAGKSFAYQIASNIPNLALLAVSRGAGLPVMFAGSAGEKFAQNLEQGVPLDVARSGAIATGGLEAGIEAIGGVGSSGFKESIKQITRSLGKEGAKEVFARGLKEIAKSAGTEGAEEFVTSASQDMVDYGLGINDKALDGIGTRAANAFLVGAGSGGVISGSAISVDAGYRMFQQKSEIVAAQDAYQQIGEAAKESKLKGRLPEKFKEFMDGVTQGTQIQDVFIPVQAFETYYQSKKISPVEAAQQLGIKEKYEAAKEAGSDISIPMSEWTEKTINTEHYEGLAQDIKFNPEGLTANELKLEQEQLKSEISQQSESAQKVEAGVQGGTGVKIDFEKSAKRVRADVEAQLKNAGVESKQAKANAALYEARYKVIGEQFGFDPYEAYKANNLTISSLENPVGTEGVLNQSGPIQPRGFKVQPSKVGDKLSLNPVEGVEVNGTITKSEAGDVFSFSKLKSTEDTLNLGADMITSIDQAAARNGATYATADLKKLKIDVNSPYADLFRAAGYKLDEKNKVFTKKLEKPRVFNQAKFEQADDQNIRGQIRFGVDSVNIDLLKNADASTFIHETGHFFVEQMHELAQMPQAPESLKKDYETLWDFVGAKPGEKLTVEQHEKAADAYETYIMEGKAPSKELKPVFARLRAWILQAYKMLVQQKVELTDEVRAVFDRMLIGDSAVSQAESEMNIDKPLISDAKSVGMSEAEYEKYKEALSEAKESAREQITSKLMADYKKTKTQEYEAKRDSVRYEVEKELNAMPIYKAIAGLQKYQTPYGTPLPSDLSVNIGNSNFKLDEAWMIAKYGKNFKKELSLPKGIVSKNGLAPQEIADIFGFASGEDLINSLMITEDKQQRIERETNARMELQNPDTVTSGQLPDEVLKAVHNEERAKVLRLELKALAQSNLPALKNIIKKIARRVPTEKAVREQAAETISKLSTKDIRPVIYKRAEVKYAKEAGQLLAKGDIEGAFEAKRKELLNFELYRAAVDARENIDKTLKDFKKKIVKSDEDISKNRDSDIVNAARALLADYGIMRADKTADEYLANIKKYDQDTYNGIQVLIEPTIAGAGDYKSVSYNAFLDLKDAVNALWDLSKSTREMEIDGKKVDKDLAKSELITQQDDIDIQSDKKKEYQTTMDKWGRTKSALLGAKASLVRTEHWADAMDVQFGGPHRRFIWQPISQAVNNYKLKKSDVLKQLESILKSNEKSFTNDPIVASEFKSEKYPGGFMFQNKQELIMAVLHSGNNSNLQKLLVGRGWGSINELGQLDRSKWDQFFERMILEGKITKSDMDMVQAIWDLNESMKPDSQKAHKQMYGYYFKEITADPIQTPFGEYRGGYMPAKVDINENEDAAIRNEKEEFESNNKSFMYPTTGRGFTKSRVDQYAAPLSLDMRLISSHIDASLRFTYIEPRVKEVARLVTDKEFRASLSRIDSAIAKDMLIPWLQRAAQQKVVLPSDDGLGRALDAGARFFRKNVAAQIMFGNVTNSLQQLTGLVVAMSLVKPRHIRNAMINYIGSPKLTANEITEKSKYMKAAMDSNIFDIANSVNDIILNPSTFEKFKNFSSKHTYFLQSAMQNLVNTVVWSGGYNQAIEEGMSESEAIQFADSSVRKSQGSMSAEDVSRFETGTATAMLFKQFVGYFNMLANLNAGELTRISRDVGLKKGAGRAFYLYMTAFMLPAVLSSMVVQLMSGKGLDQDDDDEYADDLLKTFFESQFQTFTAMIPYGGQFAVSAYNRFNDKAYDDKLNLSPVISTIEGVAGLPKTLYQNLADDADNNKKLTSDVLTFIGTFTGLPAAPLKKPINYLTDVSSGEAEPTGPIDFARGLVTGKTGNEGQ
jgi:hypothetical protein